MDPRRMLSTMPELDVADLGAVLKARRRQKRLSLRDLHELTGVSVNTLSRVERGHVPDLENFRRIVDWLDEPAERFLEPGTTSLRRMPSPATSEPIIASARKPQHSLLQWSRTCTASWSDSGQPCRCICGPLRPSPGAGTLLAEILGEMQSNLEASSRD